MADSNPTRPTPISIDPAAVDFLKTTFAAARDGRLEDADPARASEAAAFDRLCAACSTYTLVPDDEIRRVLAETAEVVDNANEYQRVTLEHDALHRLVGQLSAPAGGVNWPGSGTTPPEGRG